MRSKSYLRTCCVRAAFLDIDLPFVRAVLEANKFQSIDSAFFIYLFGCSFHIHNHTRYAFQVKKKLILCIAWRRTSHAKVFPTNLEPMENLKIIRTNLPDGTVHKHTQFKLNKVNLLGPLKMISFVFYSCGKLIQF